MSDAPVTEIDLAAFAADPYPGLAAMQAQAPITFVPQLGATLITRHVDVTAQEKRIAVFSSRQPKGLMTRLMGENMMRKDGAAHLAERRAIFPSVSPRTVRDVWQKAFRHHAEALLAALSPRGGCDIVADYAMPLSAHALRHITGLLNMAPEEMDRVSQGMIDGIANYSGDPAVEARCHAATAAIDARIDARIGAVAAAPDASLLSVQLQAGLDEAQIRANVKLAISGGQNEPRDAIAGAVWAVLAHRGVHAAVSKAAVSWEAVFGEYARWMSPIGMSPREVRRRDTVAGVTFEPGDRVFLMFGAANRDPAVFADPDRFDPARDAGHAIPFGAGPHFCAGAWSSRCLIAEVGLPMLFERLKGLRLDPAGTTRFSGWAFRGPDRVDVLWQT